MWAQRVAAAVGCALVLSLFAPSAASATYDPGTRGCQMTDARIGESSGVAAASFTETAVWTHNDSGDTARWFLVDTVTCATTATYALDVPSAQEPSTGESVTALDWEDMARGVTSTGAPTLLFGDIGDNYQFRPSPIVYEVLEPDGSAPAGATTEQPVALRAAHTLVYPSGPRDAETLLFVRPTRQLAVVTKPRVAPTAPPATGAYTGKSEVYVSAPGLPETSGPVPMTKVADVDFTQLPRHSAEVPESWATSGGDVSPDGRRVVVRCYFDAYEWDVGPGFDLGAAMAGAPTQIPLLPTQQGEAITYTDDGAALLTTSEGKATGPAPGGTIDRYTAVVSPPPAVPDARPVLLGLTIGAAMLLAARYLRPAQ